MEVNCQTPLKFTKNAGFYNTDIAYFNYHFFS